MRNMFDTEASTNLDSSVNYNCAKSNTVSNERTMRTIVRKRWLEISGRQIVLSFRRCVYSESRSPR